MPRPRKEVGELAPASLRTRAFREREEAKVAQLAQVAQNAQEVKKQLFEKRRLEKAITALTIQRRAAVKEMEKWIVKE